MKGEWWWQLWTILRERNEGIIILCLPTIIYLYVYKSVCVCTHTCATHTHAHTEPSMRNFLLSYCSVNLSNSQNNSGFLVELSCFPGSEISSFLLKTLRTQELDLSQKHAPCRLGFIVLERAMQAAMAEKQSTVLPS